jgi:ribosomal protein L11 methyltransferase
MIAPPWEDGPFPPGRQLLRIDPGMAFGTGHHATTRMCLESAERFLEEWPAHAAPIVLDLGTGTGILAIAAASLGAEKVFALDTDPEACDAARKNLAGHALATRVQIIPGSLEALDAGLRFDLILSNLDTRTLRPLFSALRARLSRDGCIMATGITTEDEEGILEAVRAAGLAIIDRRAQEGWLCLILRNKA